LLALFHAYDNMSDTISPYSPRASPKIKIRIIPTKSRSSYALALTPASPTTPMANPAAMQLNPQQRPAAMCA